MNTVHYWKNTDFNKKIEYVLEQINKSKISRTVLIEIKNNKIFNLTKLKFSWKDELSLKNLIKFINFILDQKIIYDCFFVFILSENDHYHINFEFPFFSQQKFYNSNILLYPDYFFLQDYSQKPVRGVNNENIILLNNITFASKKNNIVFRSNNRKYKFLENYFDNTDTFYDIKLKLSNKNDFLYHEQQNDYKYSIALFERNDTVYFNLLVNSIPFMICNEDHDDKRTRMTFYNYFIEDGKHFIKLKPSQLKELSTNIESYNFTNILNNKKELMNKLTYINIIKFYENIFYEYSLLFK